MKIINLPGLTPTDSLPEGGCAALGNFDGVHMGHKALFREAEKYSPAVVWTFSSPAKPNSPTPLLTDLGERLRLFSLCGMEYAVVEDFHELKDLSCEEFVKYRLSEKLRLSRVVCGENYRFGKGGTGNAADLCALCEKYGIECTVVPPVTDGGSEVSSSRIREYIRCGNTEHAERLLGHLYSFSSPVIHGKRMGSAFGVPTVNQKIPEGMAVPANGVYATAVTVDGEVFAGATDVGVRPTVEDGGALFCETNIIGCTGDLYEKTVRIGFIKRIRGEEKFSSADSLFTQIRKDAEICAAIFEQYRERSRT